MSDLPTVHVPAAWVRLDHPIHPTVFHPTHHLRWKGRLPGERVLQQAWIDHWSGDVEWREVPNEP